jgi:hypothetical protein
MTEGRREREKKCGLLTEGIKPIRSSSGRDNVVHRTDKSYNDKVKRYMYMLEKRMSYICMRHAVCELFGNLIVYYK